MSAANPGPGAFARAVDRPPRRRKKGLEYFYLMLAAAAMVAPMLLIASERSSLVDVGYRITKLREENAELREERARLRAVLESLRTPERVLGAALEQGLRPIPETNRLQIRLLEERQPEPDDDGAAALFAGVDMNP